AELIIVNAVRPRIGADDAGEKDRVGAGERREERQLRIEEWPLQPRKWGNAVIGRAERQQIIRIAKAEIQLESSVKRRLQTMAGEHKSLPRRRIEGPPVAFRRRADLAEHRLADG